MIQFDKRLPVYEQIVGYVKRQIVSGELPLDSELPSRREFAAQLQVNPNTVQRAFREMEEMGLIYTGNNVMSRVTNDEVVVANLRSEMMQQAVHEFIEAVIPLGVNHSEVLNQVALALEKEEGSQDVRS